MLQVQYIKENKETVLVGLAKRNFKNAERIVDEVIASDENRKTTQAQLDNVLSEANKISKEIGNLFKSGEVQKAGLLKEKTAILKEESKNLAAQLAAANEHLQNLLYSIPNIPNELVPSGKSEEDNEIVLEAGREMVMPGDNVTIEVHLINTIAMDVGLRFAIREGGRTVGAGQVTSVIE